MQKVLFQFKNGAQRLLKEKMANHLARAGKGTVISQGYATRDMGAQQDMIKRPTPAAIKLAEEAGIDLANVEATGAGGSITVADVKNAMPRDNV